MSLPTPRQLLNSLISSLSAVSPAPASPVPGPSTRTSPQNPLAALPESTQSLFLTLSHLLPPFLPALDLLDRRLVRRCSPPHSRRHAYFIASAESQALLVVRLGAWWCGCRDYARAAFGRGVEEVGRGENGWEGEGLVWGGRVLGQGDIPVCAHLLACVLVEECAGLFGGFVEEVEIPVERWVEIELEGR